MLLELARKRALEQTYNFWSLSTFVSVGYNQSLR